MTAPFDISELKKEAASRAVTFITDGMIVGLGSGTTAAYAVEALGKRVAAGLKIIAIPTSNQTASQAKQCNIPLTDFSAHQRLDLTIDGADEVERGSLNLIKGLGGALLREKLVAQASDRLVIIVDESKLVTQLGSRTAVPIEVVPFAWQTTVVRLEKLGAKLSLRSTNEGQAYLTDNGNYIIDAGFGAIANPAELAKDLSLIVGVVESGLFINMTSLVVVAKSTGIDLLAVTKL